VPGLLKLHEQFTPRYTARSTALSMSVARASATDPTAGQLAASSAMQEASDQHGGEGGRRLAKRVAASAGDALFVVPALALVGILLLYPIGTGIFRSLYNWDPGYASPFVGLANYTTLAGNALFQEILRNEGVFLIGVPLWVLFPLAIALFLHERVPFAGIARTVIFYPAVASPAILGVFFRSVLAPTGLLNTILHDVGAGGLAQNWLAEPNLVKPVIIVVIAWATAGVGVVIFSAALAAMEPHLLEAAEVEGASGWQKLRYVVLPTLKPVIDLYVALMVLMVFVGLFAWIYVLTQGGPGFSSTTLDYDIYQHALTYGQFGLAAAESVYLLAIVVVVVVLTHRLRKLGSRGR
jgi:ABC-type sugar transport system permease subunit